MNLNNFGLIIRPNYSEYESQIIGLHHGDTYAVTLRNDWYMEADAELWIDGVSVGIFRINPRDRVEIETRPNKPGRFTFYRAGSAEAAAEGAVAGDPNNGLIKAVFWPAKPAKRESVTPGWPDTWAKDSGFDTVVKSRISTSLTSKSLSEGATGLSGSHVQGFNNARPIDRDYEQQTTIFVRLAIVEGPSNTLRPRSTGYGYTTPIPPPIR